MRTLSPRRALALLALTVTTSSALIAAPRFDRTPAHDGRVTTVRYSPDARLVASGGFDGMVYLWDARTHERVGSFRESDPNTPVWDLRFLPDGKRLASASLFQPARLRDISSGNVLASLTAHTESVSRLAVSSDGSILYTSAGDGQILAWDTTNYKILGRTATHSPVGLVALPARGKVLVTSLGGVLLMDVLQNQVDRLLTEVEYYTAASGSALSGFVVGGAQLKKAYPALIDMDAGALASPLEIHPGSTIGNLDVALRAPRALGNFMRGEVVAWDLSRGSIIFSSAGELWDTASCAISPEGERGVVGMADGSLRWIDLPSRMETTR
jgi:hypothetical protein